MTWLRIVGLAHALPPGPCAGCCASEPCTPYFAPPPRSRRSFYLHTAIEYTDVTQCLRAHGADTRPDDSFGSAAGLLNDIIVLRDLAKHPARTFNASQAYLHVLDFPFMASVLVTNLDCGSHLKRVNRLALRFYQWRPFVNHTWLVVNSDWRHPQAVFGKDLWLKLLTLPHLVLVTVDQAFARHMHMTNYIIAPYVAHHAVESRALETRVCEHWANRSRAAVFHGTLRRRHSGALRGAVLLNLTANLATVQVAGLPDDLNVSDAMYRTVSAYGDTRFCFAPEGDTNTSRRLYDALGSACVPIRFADCCLPFADRIDYSAISFDAGPLYCNQQYIDETTEWLLSSVLHNDYAPVACDGLHVFRSHLSYRNGAATRNILRHFHIDT